MTDDTHRMLADAAAAFAKPDAARVRKWRARAPGFDRAVWERMADQGWLSLLVPEDAGGLGLGITEAAIIAERLGFALFTEPFVASAVLALRCVAGAPGPADRLADLVSGKSIATLAWQNRKGSQEVDQPDVTAAAAGGGFVLEGSSHFVPVAAADWFVVVAREGDGVALFVVPRGAAGFTVAEHAQSDGSRAATVHLAGVHLDAAARIAAGDAARDLLALARDGALVAASAELVGVMERCLEMTLTYMRERRQFGRPIGSFQALQHRAVDLWVQKEVTRAAVAAAARLVDDPAADPRARAAAASGAKSRAAQTALLMSTQAVQLHGAIGFTDEYDLGLYLHRSLVLSAWLGNAAESRRRYGALATTELPHAGGAR
jgi:alkylation response protein AidB-like acyl-CoA dehydrogenase